MFRIKLSELVKNAYGIDPDDYLDPNTYSLTADYHPTIKEINQWSKFFLDVEKGELEGAITAAANSHFESSYIEEYYRRMRLELSDKVQKDFKTLTGFFTEDCGEIPNAPLSPKINWDENYIEFDGELDSLAAIVINCINGYGMFYYDNIDDFYSAYPAVTQDEKIKWVEDHFHWLSKMEAIYGTVHNFFKFSTEYIDYYGLMGNYDVSMEEIEYELYVQSRK